MCVETVIKYVCLISSYAIVNLTAVQDSICSDKANAASQFGLATVML